MICVGRVMEVWRYPVSSIGGERMERIETAPDGVVGDRHFALFERDTGLPAAPEKDPRWRSALFLRCERSKEGQLRIRFPDGFCFRLDDTALPEALTRYFGFPVAIGMYARPDQSDEYKLPVIENRYVPSALHILTTASLQKLSQLGSVGQTDRRRFRPSILIESSETNAFLENGWIGHALYIGNIRTTVLEATKRCGMTLIAQPGIDEDPEILRNILRHNRRNLGVYGAIDRAGPVKIGDPVYADI
ncbi:MOSC domain-containing protein [Pararhizobium sp.]|uniref:MOSC domain-containing protein n=1 Tax=Pararhizobium sp. TaxID=1977563 RepID=UPI0027262850|nr:MOSC N-terminal beta barrel domain-containing protein [Pararhizobium sp.]MDO9418643.1 MOSC domain-containing protein [Pararhizobium sp.]